MNILAFDTCFAACSAAAARGFDPDAPHDACLTGRFEPMATGHAERLPLMIAETMTAAGLAFSQLDRLAVTNGPGSFTGTRIAVAAARALALASSLEVVVVSSLAVMASQAAEHLSTHIENARKSAPEAAPLLIAVDARRGEVYVQQFKSGGADPVTGPLLEGGPAELVRRYDLSCKGRYCDACHLCDTARRALRGRFPGELAPDAMYGGGAAPEP